MRIGYFTHAYPSATFTFIQAEIFALRKRGFDIRTFSVRKTGSEHDVTSEIIAEKRRTFYVLSVGLVSILARNCAAILFNTSRYFEALVLAWRTSRPGFRGHIYQLFYFQEAVILASELQRQRIEHLHAHLGDVSATVALLASRLSDVGYSITFHSSDFIFDPTHLALREKIKHSRFVVCISQFGKSQLMLFSDSADWIRLEVVHCGVDVASYVMSSPRPRAKALLFAGRLASEKGIPVLFKSLELLRRAGYDFELTLVGDGEQRAALMQLGKQLGIADRILFAGYTSQRVICEHLTRSDVFVLPSFIEGIPVSLMEAMASGVPVIGTYVGGVVELVDNGETGQVVSPGDPNALRDAIARYFDSYELREKVSRNGREKVAADFDLHTQVNRLAALFKEHAGPWRA